MWQTKLQKYVWLLCPGEAQGHFRLGDCHAAVIHGELLACPFGIEQARHGGLTARGTLAFVLGTSRLVAFGFGVGL